MKWVRKYVEEWLATAFSTISQHVRRGQAAHYDARISFLTTVEGWEMSLEVSRSISFCLERS